MCVDWSCIDTLTGPGFETLTSEIRSILMQTNAGVYIHLTMYRSRGYEFDSLGSAFLPPRILPHHTHLQLRHPPLLPPAFSSSLRRPPHQTGSPAQSSQESGQGSEVISSFAQVSTYFWSVCVCVWSNYLQSVQDVCRSHSRFTFTHYYRFSL